MDTRGRGQAWCSHLTWVPLRANQVSDCSGRRGTSHSPVFVSVARAACMTFDPPEEAAASITQETG